MITSYFHRAIAVALSIAILPNMPAYALSDAWSQGDSLSAMTPQAGAGYGAAVSADGDVVVVGQPRATVNGVAGVGSADVWRRTATGWTREATLFDHSPKTDAHFGATVLIKDDTIYVSSPDQPNGASTPGAGAYETFLHNASTGTWDWHAQNFGGNSNGHYGAALAAQGNLFAASTPGITFMPSGFVDVSYADQGFTGSATLKGFDGASGDKFGTSVALYRSNDSSPDFAVVGAPDKDDGFAGPNNGEIYIFSNSTHVGNGWQEMAHFTAPDSTPNQFFGQSVAIGKGIIVIGAPGRDKTTGTPVNGAGSIFVYGVNDDGDWVQENEIFLSSPAAGDGFGSAVAYDASTGLIFAGAPNRVTNLFGGSGPTGTVAVFRFEHITNFVFGWVDVAELESLDFPSVSQSAGMAIAVSDGSAFIGAPDYDGGGTAANSGRMLTFTADEIFLNGFE